MILLHMSFCFCKSDDRSSSGVQLIFSVSFANQCSDVFIVKRAKKKLFSFLTNLALMIIVFRGTKQVPRSISFENMKAYEKCLSNSDYGN